MLSLVLFKILARAKAITVTYTNNTYLLKYTESSREKSYKGKFYSKSYISLETRNTFENDYICIKF